MSSDAVKYTDEGSVTLRVTLPASLQPNKSDMHMVCGKDETTSAEGESESVAGASTECEHAVLLFEVVDTGAGVPKENIDTIFKPFTQGPKVSHRPVAFGVYF